MLPLIHTTRFPHRDGCSRSTRLSSLQGEVWSIARTRASKHCCLSYVEVRHVGAFSLHKTTWTSSFCAGPFALLHLYPAPQDVDPGLRGGCALRPSSRPWSTRLCIMLDMNFRE